MQQFLVSLIFVFALCAPAALAADDTSDAKAAFRAAYASYNAAIEAGDAEAALAAATKALELGPKIYANDSPSLAALYVNKGNALLEAHQSKDAIPLLKAGIKRLGKIYGKKDEKLLDPISSLAEAYGSARQKDKKVAQMRTYLKVVENVFGDESLEYAQASQHLGEASYTSFTR